MRARPVPMLVPVLPLVLVMLTSCAGRTCSDVGSVDGLLVEVAPALLRSLGPASLQVEVCDAAGCVVGETQVPPGSAGSGPSVVDVGPTVLGRGLEAGGAVAEVALVDRRGEQVAAVTGVDVALEVQYPNGQGCEPGGVAGRVALGPDDRA